MLGGGFMVMEHHSSFKWREADYQSDVAAEFQSSQASTLSSVLNNVIQHLISVKPRPTTVQGHEPKKKENSDQLMKAVGKDLVIHWWNCNNACSTKASAYCYHGAPFEMSTL